MRFAALLDGTRGLVEDAVAGSRALGDVDGWAFGEFEGDGVDVVDAYQVGAEIGNDQILIRGIEDDLMGMWVGLLFFRTWRAHAEVEVLGQDELSCERVDGVGGESVGVMGDSQQLCPIGTFIED